jgi:hypothetical protein
MKRYGVEASSEDGLGALKRLRCDRKRKDWRSTIRSDDWWKHAERGEGGS